MSLRRSTGSLEIFEDRLARLLRMGVPLAAGLRTLSSESLSAQLRKGIGDVSIFM